jgi:AraC-like DNA-binding protein
MMAENVWMMLQFFTMSVGYRDASHFNRECKSLFGVPPMREAHRLRARDPIATISLRHNARSDSNKTSAAERR